MAQTEMEALDNRRVADAAHNRRDRSEILQRRPPKYRSHPGYRGATDLDLDMPEAIAAAPYLLPKTAVFGHASKPASH